MFGETATHSISEFQLVAGSDRRMQHGINLASDTIQQVGMSRLGCGILDLDFMALMNVKLRAMACLLRSFLETAAHPVFRHNMFHEILFRYHVLEEHDLPDPGLTTYYNNQFFDTLRYYQVNSKLKIPTMTIK